MPWPRKKVIRVILLHSDAPFIRVLEDLIDVLVDNGALKESQLPKEALLKLEARRKLRTERADIVAAEAQPVESSETVEPVETDDTSTPGLISRIAAKITGIFKKAPVDGGSTTDDTTIEQP